MSSPALISQQWLTPEELGEKLSVKAATLAEWRSAGKGPIYMKIGREIKYAIADVEAWLQSSRRGGRHHGNPETKRDVALPIRVARPALLRNNRLGGHRTKQESGRGI